MGAIFQSLGRTVLAGFVILVVLILVAGTLSSELPAKKTPGSSGRFSGATTT